MTDESNTGEEQNSADLMVSVERYVELLHEFIHNKEHEFSTFICQAVLETGDLATNPFAMRAGDSERTKLLRGYSALYGDLAKIFLMRLAGEKYDLSQEFIPLFEWISNETPAPHVFAAHFVPGNFTVPFQERIIYIYFHHNEEKLGYALLNACELVYNGMPLYKKKQDSDEFALVPFADEEYIYLSQKGRLSDTHPTGMFPEWALNYFIRRDHLEAHKIFFGGDYHNDEQTNTARRAAFRRHIGFEAYMPASTSSTQADHPSEAWELAQIVIKRYYGAGFDINRQETWTSQPTIVAWLKDTYNLSTRRAEAIDIVTRPDRIK